MTGCQCSRPELNGRRPCAPKNASFLSTEKAPKEIVQIDADAKQIRLQLDQAIRLFKRVLSSFPIERP